MMRMQRRCVRPCLDVIGIVQATPKWLKCRRPFGLPLARDAAHKHCGSLCCQCLNVASVLHPGAVALLRFQA